MTEFKDNSSSFSGKMLKAIVRVSDTEIVEASLYYSREYTERKNEWGVTMRDLTGTHKIILNASCMRQDGAFYSGGLGKNYEMVGGFKRQTLKDLQKIAEKLDDAGLIAAAQGDSQPTLLFGDRK